MNAYCQYGSNLGAGEGLLGEADGGPAAGKPGVPGPRGVTGLDINAKLR